MYACIHLCVFCVRARITKTRIFWEMLSELYNYTRNLNFKVFFETFRILPYYLFAKIYISFFLNNFSDRSRVLVLYGVRVSQP